MENHLNQRKNHWSKFRRLHQQTGLRKQCGACSRRAERRIEITPFQIMSKDAEGMKGIRSRNENGRLRQKRSDTLIGTIEKQYGVNLWVRSDMTLGTYLKKRNAKSLNDLMSE